MIFYVARAFTKYYLERKAKISQTHKTATLPHFLCIFKKGRVIAGSERGTTERVLQIEVCLPIAETGGFLKLFRTSNMWMKATTCTSETIKTRRPVSRKRKLFASIAQASRKI